MSTRGQLNRIRWGAFGAPPEREREEALAQDQDPKHQAELRERQASGVERLHQIVAEAEAKGMTDNYVALISVRQAKDLLEMVRPTDV